MNHMIFKNSFDGFDLIPTVVDHIKTVRITVKIIIIIIIFVYLITLRKLFLRYYNLE